MLGKVQLELQKLVDGYVGTFLFWGGGWGVGEWMGKAMGGLFSLLSLKYHLNDCDISLCFSELTSSRLSLTLQSLFSLSFGKWRCVLVFIQYVL